MPISSMLLASSLESSSPPAKQSALPAINIAAPDGDGRKRDSIESQVHAHALDPLKSSRPPLSHPPLSLSLIVTVKK